MSEDLINSYIDRFSCAPSIDRVPAVIDVRGATPPNPPEAVQRKFVGASYTEAYAEAGSFVRVVDEMLGKHGLNTLEQGEAIMDFGSGWGRVTRMLLTKASATHVYAVDVDADMTALVNDTLPGVNAMTVRADPPTIVGTGAIDCVLAFSVFSHLAPGAHQAWAREFGRIVRTGGAVAITVLDEAFFAQVEGAQAAVSAGDADEFATDLATTFPDLGEARAGYEAGQIQYAGVGGGEVRTGDYYGWAACPIAYIQSAWGEADFRILEWVPSGVLFPQALVLLAREPAPRKRRLHRLLDRR